MSLLSVEISRERIRAMEDELAAIQWAAEIRRSRRATARRVVTSTGRATVQEGNILRRRLTKLFR